MINQPSLSLSIPLSLSCLLATLLFSLAGKVLAEGADSLSSKRPNIIVMVADDLGWADVGFHGGDIDTPALDRLANEGMQLDRFYTTPICSPTRAALMTGRDPMRLGVAYATIKPWDNFGVNPAEHFMPESFLASGYQTAMIGKWHLGHAQQSYHPNQRGFEYFYGHLHTEVGYFPPFASQGGKDLQRNGQSIDIKNDPENPQQNYETYLLANEATQYIRLRDKDKPFFIYMPFLAPHTPLEAPQELLEKYQDINTDLPLPRTKSADRMRKIAKLTLRKSVRPAYAAVVDAMDQSINKILNTLDQQGIADNTIVLFFSDNGGATYTGGGANNAPLRGGKGETYEGGIRVVSLMRWPEKIPAGKKLDQIVSVMDVFPTLADAAGIKPQNHFKFDGQSFWPAMHNNQKINRDDYLFFISESPIYGHFNITAFNDQWKLVQVIEQDQLQTTVDNQLYQINTDPYEYKDVAQQHPQVVSELSERIRRWRAQYPISGIRSHLMPPPGWRAPLDWASYPKPLDQLQTEIRYLFPKQHLKTLDQRHGERGRMTYSCDYEWWDGGHCEEIEK